METAKIEELIIQWQIFRITESMYLYEYVTIATATKALVAMAMIFLP